MGLSFWPFWANLWVGVRFKTFLEPTYVDNQLWFWKVSLIFSFLIWSNLGPFLNYFWAFGGYFFGLGSDSKNLLLPTYIDNQLWFWKYSHIFLFSIWPHLGPFLHFFGPFGAIFFGPLGLIVWLGSGSKTFLEPTYVDNQLWFWKVSLIFSFLIWSNLGPFLNYFWAFGGYFFGLGSDSKNLLLPTYIDNQLWFWKYSHIFLFSIWPHLGPFLHFFGPFGAIFFGPLGLIVWLGSGSKTFLEPTYVENQLWFWKYSPIFLFIIWPNLGPFLHFLGLSRLFLGLGSSSKKILRPTYID